MTLSRLAELCRLWFGPKLNDHYKSRICTQIWSKYKALSRGENWSCTNGIRTKIVHMVESTDDLNGSRQKSMGVLFAADSRFRVPFSPGGVFRGTIVPPSAWQLNLDAALGCSVTSCLSCRCSRHASLGYSSAPVIKTHTCNKGFFCGKCGGCACMGNIHYIDDKTLQINPSNLI